MKQLIFSKKIDELFVFALLGLCASWSHAQQVTGAQIQNVQITNAQVVVDGQVPNDEARLSILENLRKVYGSSNVIDRIEVVDSIATPPNWTENVSKLLNSDLKHINKGQLQISGTQLVLNGEVANEPLRQKLLSNMASSLNPTYSIRNNLQVPVAGSQEQIEQVIANRTIEFESGSATLTARGRKVLDEVVPVLSAQGEQKLSLVGHTDNSGERRLNLSLSQSRADAVKGYLVEKGIAASRINTSGVGPDQPIASNDSADGRAKNRRIDFRVGG